MMLGEIREALGRPDSLLQRVLSDYAMTRIRASERYWSQRHPAWRESENLHRAFRTPDKSDQQTALDPDTEGVTKIVVPYSYAVTQSMLAFFMTVFTDRKPIIPVEGVGSTAPRAAIYHEELLQQQMDEMRPRGVLVMLQQIFDSLRYGIGIIKNAWGIREWPEVRRLVQPVVDPMTGQVRFVDQMLEENVTAYEGNMALNVQPFVWFPDPRRTMSNFQDGEFCGHAMRMSETELRQKQAQGLYAGVEHIPKGSQSTQDLREAAQSDLARTLDMTSLANATDFYGRPYVDIHELWAYFDPELLRVPQEINFQPTAPIRKGTPRLWVFTVANRRRVIRAEPAMLPGRAFPFTALELNYDIHSPANIGMIETFRGLQYILSWLFNSRMKNVRKTLNNELVIDPSQLEAEDYMRPNPAGLIRLSKAAQGQGVDLRTVVSPLPTVDVTAGHHTDARVVTDLIEQITGANRLIMGVANPGRRAATEVQGQLSLASGRMKLLALLASAQGFEPWCLQMTLNNQTFIREPMTMRLRPEYAAIMGEEVVTVTPELLQGKFRFPFLESGVPTDRQFEANIWREVMALGMQNPEGAMALGIRLDTVFRRLLRVMGIKNLADFFGQAPGMGPAMVAANEDVQQGVRGGNLVPADGFPLSPGPNQNGSGLNGQANQAA